MMLIKLDRATRINTNDSHTSVKIKVLALVTRRYATNAATTKIKIWQDKYPPTPQYFTQVIMEVSPTK